MPSRSLWNFPWPFSNISVGYPSASACTGLKSWSFSCFLFFLLVSVCSIFHYFPISFLFIECFSLLNAVLGIILAMIYRFSSQICKSLCCKQSTMCHLHNKSWLYWISNTLSLAVTVDSNRLLSVHLLVLYYHFYWCQSLAYPSFTVPIQLFSISSQTDLLSSSLTLTWVGSKHRQFSFIWTYMGILSGTCWSARKQENGLGDFNSDSSGTITMGKTDIVKTIYKCMLTEDKNKGDSSGKNE